jgi:hypothetical protein
MNRRSYLVASASGALAAVAGCLGGDDSQPLDPETPPEELLPDTDQWPLGETVDQIAQIVGADEGILGWYEQPDTDDYSVEVLRFRDRSNAEEYVSARPLTFRYGAFSFYGDGPDHVSVRELLAASPGLTAEVVASKTPDTGGFPTDGSNGNENGGENGDENGGNEDNSKDSAPTAFLSYSINETENEVRIFHESGDAFRARDVLVRVENDDELIIEQPLETAAEIDAASELAAGESIRIGNEIGFAIASTDDAAIELLWEPSSGTVFSAESFYNVGDR